MKGGEDETEYFERRVNMDKVELREKIKKVLQDWDSDYIDMSETLDQILALLQEKPEMSEELDFLDRVSKKGKEMLTICEKENFVFDNLKDRWQKLAFTFYSEIVALSSKAETISKLYGEKPKEEANGYDENGNPIKYGVSGGEDKPKEEQWCECEKPKLVYNEQKHYFQDDYCRECHKPLKPNSEVGKIEELKINPDPPFEVRIIEYEIIHKINQIINYLKSKNE